MFNQALADKIVEYLNVTFPDKTQLDDLRAALPEFSTISEVEWLKSLDALNHDGRVEFKGIRTGFDDALQMVANIVITNAERGRLAKPASAGRTVTSSVGEHRPSSHSGLAVFISHSSKDTGLALALIDLLKAGLALTANQIRCSSVDGYRLPVGVNSESKLREEVNAARVVVGLITPSSLASYYVMFELGARWGANLFLAPLLAGVKASDLSGPLSLLNALSASSDAQLHQLVADIAHNLGLPLQPAASYIRNVHAVKALADAITNPAPVALVASPVKPKLKVKLSAEGTPPSQVLRVAANRSVEVTRVEYMLNSEATIAARIYRNKANRWTFL